MFQNLCLGLVKFELSLINLTKSNNLLMEQGSKKSLDPAKEAFLFFGL
jgi:hypothetical protein